MSFDKFTLAFESFDGIREDLGYVSSAVKMQKEHTQYMKEQSIRNMLKVYNLQKMKVKSTKLYESLKYLQVLKQMLPILENLIEQAGNFETALDLITNASNMLETKLQNVKL